MEADQRPKRSVHFEEAIGLEDQQFLDVTKTALAVKQVEGSFCIGGLDDLPDPVEPSEHEQDRNRGRYNLRKSLAWDSAFFTSAGFLDPEELSSMIIGADNPDKQMLCGIQEEVAVSTESISTLGSDSLTLEALEDDIFVDIRASIQRSNWKASNSSNSTGDKDPKNLDQASNTGTTVKKELTLQDKKNNRPIVKKTSGIQSVRALKPEPIQNVRNFLPDREVKHTSAHSQGVQMKIGTRSEKISTLANVPKGVNRSTTRATKTEKREVARNSHAKAECGNPLPAVVSCNATLQSKVLAINGARLGMPKPAVPLNSKRVQSLRSSASSDSSSSMFYAPQVKPTVMIPQRNPSGSSTKVSGPSCAKTPSKVELRNKKPASALPNCLVSAKLSSNPSPAGSVSEWSSASSGSTSKDKHFSSILRTSVDRVCVESMKDIVLDQRSHSGGKTVGFKTQDVNSRNSKKSLPQHGTQQASAKPSGLRMPTPKIGFFDGVKSNARTPNQTQQDPVLSKLLRKGAVASVSPVGTVNAKMKKVNLSPESAVISASAKVDSTPRRSSGLTLGMKSNSHGRSSQKLEKINTENVKDEDADAVACVQNTLQKNSVPIGDANDKDAPIEDQEKRLDRNEENSNKTDIFLTGNKDVLTVNRDTTDTLKGSIHEKVESEDIIVSEDNSQVPCIWGLDLKHLDHNDDNVLISHEMAPTASIHGYNVNGSSECHGDGFTGNDFACGILTEQPEASGVPLQESVCKYTEMSNGMRSRTVLDEKTGGKNLLEEKVPAEIGVTQLMEADKAFPFQEMLSSSVSGNQTDEIFQPVESRDPIVSMTSVTLPSIVNLDSPSNTSSSLSIGINTIETRVNSPKMKEILAENGVSQMREADKKVQLIEANMAYEDINGTSFAWSNASVSKYTNLTRGNIAENIKV